MERASARLGSARLGSARLGSARLGSARLGSARLGSARLGSARLGSARLGSARLGSARLGSARLGSARLGSARLGSARLGSAIYYSSAKPNPRQNAGIDQPPNAACQGDAPHPLSAGPVRRRIARTLHRLLTVNEGHLFTPAGRADVLTLLRSVQPVPRTQLGSPLRAAAHSACSATAPPGNLLNSLTLLFPVVCRIPDGLYFDPRRNYFGCMATPIACLSRPVSGTLHTRIVSVIALIDGLRARTLSDGISPKAHQLSWAHSDERARDCADAAMSSLAFCLRHGVLPDVVIY